MKRLILIIAGTCLMAVSDGQYVSEFSADTGKYINELTTLFGNLLQEDEQEEFEAFVMQWDSLDYDRRLEIMEISELMRQRSCRPRPQFIDFIGLLNYFFTRPDAGKYYDSWISGYRKFMSSEETLLKQINNIHRSTRLVLEENKIFESVSVQWVLRRPEFDFMYSDRLWLTVEGNDLVCYSGGDSIELFNIAGRLDLLSLDFHGEEGKVYWERAGFGREEIFAALDNFRISLKEPGYKADSVVFHYDELLKEPALGELEDRVSQFKTPAQARFPKFYTYKSSYNLENFLDGINFRGGLSMQGANLAGTGVGGERAVLEIYSNDTLRLVAHSEMFLFGASSILSNHAMISIYVESDSIYHPDLILNYNIEREQLRLTKSDDYNSQGPYANSYHNIDMNFQELAWVRNEPEMRFQAAMGTALGNASFESYDYFNMEFYASLQGMDWQHPLAELWAYANLVKSPTFPVKSYAVNQRKDTYIIRHQLMEFSKLGFVYFDFEKDEVTLRDKLYDYIDASLQKRDYDVMRFISRTTGQEQNAILNIYTKDLNIFGIPTIFLSDSQNVKLVPASNTIVMKRNRNFQFDGIIDAGLFKFYGKNFFFEYDNFLINLQNIDSLSMSALTGERDGYGNPLVTTIDNKIENITGELLIDAPFNKSGLMHYPEYPIFTSREKSYIYFDEKTIQDGVYDRERFFFELDGFSIDSLDNFSRDNIKLEGTFTSAGVLPDLDMEMTLRPDNSLGFYMTTPEEGLPLFGGKALFFNDIEMSSRGLRGYGSFDYITSTTWSDDFLFHPDSMMTTSREFLIRERRQARSYPYAENTETRVRFYPFEDELSINKIEEIFKIFDEETAFSGDLSLRPSGLFGDGVLGFHDARFESPYFAFGSHQVNADSAGVKLRPDRGEEFNFLTEDVGLAIDLDKREGEFTARTDYTIIEFPENLYETQLDNMQWFMDRDEVVLTQRKSLSRNSVDIGIDSLRTNAPPYISRHPQQDSLHFVAGRSTFFYPESRIAAEQVPFVEVGDAYVFPHKRQLEIGKEANMATLENAKVMANKDSRYHLMHSAKLKIDSRLHFKGSASYDYVDETGEVYTFWLDQVEVDTSIETRGSGKVLQEDEFRLSPYFAFRGEIRMNASDPLLEFLGGARLTHDCRIVSQQWMKFESRLDPDSLLIPTGPEIMNQDLRDIYAGTLIARDSAHIYPTFLSGRKNYFDRNITNASGFVYYDKRTGDYELGSIEKIRNANVEGNLVRLEADSCVLFGEGRLDFPLDYGQVDINAVGEATHDIAQNTLELRMLFGMDFLFSPEALQMFGNEIDSIADLEPVDLTSDFYVLGMKNLAGTALADQLETDLGLTGTYSEIPDSLKYSIFFNDLRLKWNQETRSFRLNGKTGIGLIGDVQVNKQVEAYIEMVERGSGDIFDIYLMVDSETWYYFAYSPGGLQVLSSNRDFNQFIMDLPERERRIRGGVGRASYVYSLASPRRLELFLDRFLSYEE